MSEENAVGNGHVVQRNHQLFSPRNLGRVALCRGCSCPTTTTLALCLIPWGSSLHPCTKPMADAATLLTRGALRGPSAVPGTVE